MQYPTQGAVVEAEDQRDPQEDDPPEKQAAEGRGGGEKEHPQDDTDNELLDHDEHSDAPGPFGTG
jgi:hypothetical protein